ncbi:hypothetical protein ACFSFZ_03935 [Mixta tenebrionis]|uniref:Uncharacterized protein n=1 Tax=Mixta tenebrionis TaxID=2562439 RepID=A0A506VFR8_9GAMM|nr:MULTISPECIES: hypothetical protein [Mixta]TPW44169.1 hypothetical protein FKM52_00190 [Mixta tenebrionis]
MKSLSDTQIKCVSGAGIFMDMLLETYSLFGQQPPQDLSEQFQQLDALYEKNNAAIAELMSRHGG